MYAAVLGHPIAHSLSPVLHRAAYAELGLSDWSYELIDVEPSGLGQVMSGLGADWRGFSVTMPLKVPIIPFLDHLEGLAKVTQVVNTVVPESLGRARGLLGINTDVYGIVQAVREMDAARGGEAVILGAGATAISALAALPQLGIEHARVWARNPARTAPLRRACERMGLNPTVESWPEHRESGQAMRKASLVISTVPQHAADSLAAHLDGTVSGALLDVIYDPRPSELVSAWRRIGGQGSSGEVMLLHQAAEQVKLMTGRPAPVEAMRRGLHDYLGSIPADSK